MDKFRAYDLIVSIGVEVCDGKIGNLLALLQLREMNGAL